MSAPRPSLAFLAEEEPEGWRRLTSNLPGRYFDTFGEVRFKQEPDGRVRARIDTGPGHANVHDGVNGGFILAFVDLAVSAAPAFAGLYDFGGAVTLRAGANFIAPAKTGRPLEAVSEIVAATGRTVFVQGVIEQDGRRIAAFEGLMKRLRSGS